MKKILMVLAVICMSLFIFACTADEPAPQATTPTPAPVVETTPIPTPAPTPEPEPVAPDIEVTLNNHHTRYYDDDETQFDITVAGDIDSYEIVFVPIGSSRVIPELAADGLPYGVGKYSVVVNYTIGNTTDEFESDIIVSIIRRPIPLEELTGIFDIPGHVKWGKETFIFVDEDTTIETDYYIAHLKAGFVYSSWLFPYFDEIIDFLHDFTGLYLPDRGERFNLYFAYDDPEQNIWAPSSDRNRTTGELEMRLTDGLVGIDTLGFWNYRGKDSYSVSSDSFYLVYQASHEFAHMLDMAFFTDNIDNWSFVHGEGFATFISAITEESIIPDTATAAQFPLSVNVDPDKLSDLFHDRLEFALGLDDGSAEYNPRTIGGVFYLYVYEEFGMEYATEVFSAMVTRPSSPRIATINDILGANINDTFPEWFDDNVHRIRGSYA